MQWKLKGFDFVVISQNLHWRKWNEFPESMDKSYHKSSSTVLLKRLVEKRQWRIVQCTTAPLEGKSPLHATKYPVLWSMLVFNIPGEGNGKQLPHREIAITLQVWKEIRGLSTRAIEKEKSVLLRAYERNKDNKLVYDNQNSQNSLVEGQRLFRKRQSKCQTCI